MYLTLVEPTLNAIRLQLRLGRVLLISQPAIDGRSLLFQPLHERSLLMQQNIHFGNHKHHIPGQAPNIRQDRMK